MANSSTGTPIVVDTAALKRLAKALRDAAPEVRNAYRRSMRASMTVVLKDAQSRAGYSTRIPGSGRIRTTSAGNVKVTFGGNAAPDAAPIENKGKGFVRHPVFGNRNVWTAKNSKPAFLGPAFEAHRVEVAKAVGSAVERAVSDLIEGG